MEFKVYPFKREKKYRCYVKFTDADGYKCRLSAGVVMPLKHTNKQRKKAKKQAEEAAIKKIREDLGYGKKEKKPEILTLSKYLKAKYYPYLRTNRAPRTLETYKRSMDKFVQICGNRPLEAYQRSHIEEYKNHRFDENGVKKQPSILRYDRLKQPSIGPVNRNSFRNLSLEVNSTSLMFKTKTENSKSTNFSVFSKRQKEL